MSDTQKMLVHEDLRVRRAGRTIDYLDGLRRSGFRHTEIPIDTYEQLVMENLSLHGIIESHMKAYGSMLAMGSNPIVMPVMPSKFQQMVEEHETKTGELMINCDFCRSRHPANAACQTPPGPLPRS